MAHRTRSLSKSSRRKAQFFLLGTVMIVTVLFFLSRIIEPSAVTDTSQAILGDEVFLFDDVKEKAFAAVGQGTTNCQDVTLNLEEYKIFVENFAVEKGYFLFFNYTTSPCFVDTPIIFVTVNQTLFSPTKRLNALYEIPWPN